MQEIEVLDEEDYETGKVKISKYFLNQYGGLVVKEYIDEKQVGEVYIPAQVIRKVNDAGFSAGIY